MDFKIINKTIREYIKYTLNTLEQINNYVPNTHIAEGFKDVLVYSECEFTYQDDYHQIKHDPLDKIGPKRNPNDYDILSDGRFQLKETYSIGINDILIPKYFDIDRLKQNPIEEIHKSYQLLRDKRDLVRNNLKLANIVTNKKHQLNKLSVKSNKIKIKTWQ
jgi:hypothetical protein